MPLQIFLQRNIFYGKKMQKIFIENTLWYHYNLKVGLVSLYMGIGGEDITRLLGIMA